MCTFFSDSRSHLKKGVLVLALSVFCFQTESKAQVFHVQDTSAVLIKTTDQSPAHWYIEIINDVGVDTTLRWVAHFNNIPNEWVINLDDQNTNISPVNDLDSADFVLHPLVDFPQKLIIGATLNNQPGHGIVYFDIFDPANRQDLQTISYEFIVSTSGISELYLPTWLIQKGGIIYAESTEKCFFKVYDLSGKSLGEAQNQLNINNYTGEIIVHAFSKEKNAVLRFFQP
jgi:hypothetical protein